MLYRLVVLVGRPFVWVAFRPRVRGRDVLPPDGFVLAPNHLSGFDSVAVACALPSRRIRSMAKRQLFERPLLGPAVRAFGAFPAAGGVDTAVALARDGEVIAIFPEGARRRADRVHRFRTGAARVALAAGVPLVPVGLRGTDRWRRFGRWDVVFGEPVAIGDLGDSPDGAREATRRLQEAVAALLVV